MAMCPKTLLVYVFRLSDFAPCLDGQLVQVLSLLTNEQGGTQYLALPRPNDLVFIYLFMFTKTMDAEMTAVYQVIL